MTCGIRPINGNNELVVTDHEGASSPNTTEAPNRIRTLSIGAALVTATVVLHLVVPGAVPTGPDTGNWLAMARELLGNDAMSAQVFYPPVFPFVVALLLSFLEPVLAIGLAAIASKILLALAVFVCGRSLGPWLAGLGAVLVVTAGAQLDAYAWGAYPQILSTALALFCVVMLLHHVDSRSPVHLWIGVASGVVATFTHLLVGGLLMFALPLAIMLRLRSVRGDSVPWGRGIATAALVLIPGGVSLAASTLFLPIEGFQPPINPLELDRWSWLAYTVRDAPVPWIALTVFGLWDFASQYRRGRSSTISVVAISWVAVGTGFFLITGEARSLLLAQVGLVLLAVAALRHLFEDAPSEQAGTKRRYRPAPRRVLIVLAFATIAGLAAGGIDSYVGAAGWFRVVDRPELEGLTILRESAQTNDLVVAAIGNNGHPLGWPVEGYAGVPTYSGHDTRWLAFPQEREQAEIANEIFSGRLTDARARSMLAEIGADFLVLDRRGPDASWLESPLAQTLPLLFDSPTLVILEVPSS